MSTTTNATTPAFIRTPRGTLVPRVITQDYLNADPERHAVLAEVALSHAAALPDDDGWCFSVLMSVVDAIQDGGAVVIQYRNDDGVVSARCLFPSTVTVTAERHLACRAYCTARRETRTFRLDRILDCHTLTLPCEAVA